MPAALVWNTTGARAAREPRSLSAFRSDLCVQSLSRALPARDPGSIDKTATASATRAVKDQKLACMCTKSVEVVGVTLSAAGNGSGKLFGDWFCQSTENDVRAVGSQKTPSTV